MKIVSDEDEAGKVREFEGHTAVENAILDDIHDKCFYLSEQAPICKGQTRDTFGYLATPIVARQVLEGTYIYPGGFDEATKGICGVCA